MNRISKIFIISLFSLMILALAGCKSADEDRKAEKNKVNNEKLSFPVEVTDDQKQVVTVSKKPTRIISLTPASTEVLFALGLDSEIVGVTTYCDYPDQAKKKEKIGDFQNPNLEKIIALEADLVIGTAGVQENLIQKLKKIETPLYVMDPKSIKGIIEDIREIGHMTGQDKKAEQLAGSMEKEIDRIKEAVAKLERNPRVFLELSAEPIYTAGTETFQDDLIVIAGGINIGAQAGQGFALIDKEALLKADPELYIAGKGTMSEPGALYQRPGFESVSAVKNKRVFIFDDNLIMRPGPRIVQGLEQLFNEINNS